MTSIPRSSTNPADPPRAGDVVDRLSQVSQVQLRGSQDSTHSGATLRNASDALAGIARALGDHPLASEIEQDSLRRLGDQRLRVAVIGEIKHGKSTLINALIGKALLPTGVTPTTAAIATVRSDSREPLQGLWACDDADARTRLDDDSFRALARGKASVDATALPSVRLECVVQSEVLPESIELVDTPGLNDIARFRSAVSRAQLPRADVLLVVFDASQVVTRTELDTLTSAMAAIGGGIASGVALEVVINRIDLVDDADRAALLAHVREQLAGLINGEFPIYCTDARRALERPGDEDDSVVAVARLRARLVELVSSRTAILPQRMRAVLIRNAKLLRYGLSVQLRAVELSDQVIVAERERIAVARAAKQRQLDSSRREIDERREQIVSAANSRLAIFEGSLVAEVSEKLTTMDHVSVADILPGALHDAFIEHVRKESTKLRDELDTLMREQVATHGAQATVCLRNATLHLAYVGPSLYLEPPSFTIEAATIALGVAGTAVMYLGGTVPGLLMAIASPLVSMLLKETTVRAARDRARILIPGAMRGVCQEFSQTVDAATAQYCDGLLDYLTSVGESWAVALDGALQSAQARVAEGHASAKERLESQSAAAARSDAEPTDLGAESTAPGLASKPADANARAHRPVRDGDPGQLDVRAWALARAKARRDLVRLDRSITTWTETLQTLRLESFAPPSEAAVEPLPQASAPIHQEGEEQEPKLTTSQASASPDETPVHDPSAALDQTLDSGVIANPNDADTLSDSGSRSPSEREEQDRQARHLADSNSDKRSRKQDKRSRGNGRS